MQAMASTPNLCPEEGLTCLTGNQLPYRHSFNLHIPRKSFMPLGQGSELELPEMGRLPKGTAGQKLKWKAGQTGPRAGNPAISNHL